MVPRPKGEESEALNRAGFASLGQKRRAFEPLCLSYSNGFLDTQPDPLHITDLQMLPGTGYFYFLGIGKSGQFNNN
jgi:hypothetical protein